MLRSLVMRGLSAIVLAGAVSAAAAAGQLWLAVRTRAYWPQDAFRPIDEVWGNLEWPAQLTVLVWSVASSVLLGVAVSRSRPGPWRVLASGAAAVGGVFAALPLARNPAARVVVDVDAVGSASRAVVVGAFVGGLAALVLLRWRGAGRSAVVWVGWILAASAIAVATYPQHWTGRERYTPIAPLLADAAWPMVSAIALAAVLGWWAAHQGDPQPVLGALTGPLLVLAVSAGVMPLVTDDVGSAVPAKAIFGWFLAALVGGLLAAPSAYVIRAHRGTDQADLM